MQIPLPYGNLSWLSPTRAAWIGFLLPIVWQWAARLLFHDSDFSGLFSNASNLLHVGLLGWFWHLSLQRADAVRFFAWRAGALDFFFSLPFWILVGGEPLFWRLSFGVLLPALTLLGEILLLRAVVQLRAQPTVDQGERLLGAIFFYGVWFRLLSALPLFFLGVPFAPLRGNFVVVGVLGALVMLVLHTRGLLFFRALVAGKLERVKVLHPAPWPLQPGVPRLMRDPFHTEDALLQQESSVGDGPFRSSTTQTALAYSPSPAHALSVLSGRLLGWAALLLVVLAFYVVPLFFLVSVE